MAVEQNANAGGVHNYSWNGSLAGNGYGSVRGFEHAPANNATNSIGDGTFVRTPDGAVYRMAGGAPIYVSTWSIYGGVQPVTDVGDLSQFRQFPADGTFLNDAQTGTVLRALLTLMWVTRRPE